MLFGALELGLWPIVSSLEMESAPNELSGIFAKLKRAALIIPID